MYHSPPPVRRHTSVTILWGAFWRMAVRVFGCAVLAGGLYGAVFAIILGEAAALLIGAAAGLYLGTLAGLLAGGGSGLLLAGVSWWWTRTPAEFDFFRYRTSARRASLLPSGLGLVLAIITVFFDPTFDAAELRFFALFPLVPLALAAACCWWASGKVAAWVDRQMLES